MNEMTMRERMLAVIQGHEHDRVPFVVYDELVAPREEVWSALGRENVGLLRWTQAHKLEYPNCRFGHEKIERDGRRGLRTTLHTPVGSLFEERFYEPAFGSSSVSSHYVQEPRDYEVLLAYLRDVVVLEDIESVIRVQQDLGDDGIPHTSVGRTPFQQLWVEWVSLEDVCVHFIDCPDILDECICEMIRIQRQILEALRNSPAPYALFADNITAPAIGERYFRQYCVPMYDLAAEMLAEKGVPVFVHMDGDLKPLWSAIAGSGVRGLDSFSPPPDNDTSAADAVSIWPEMRLLLNFPSSVHLAAPEVIHAKATQILEEAGHSGRLQIQISENVPAWRWRESFPEIIKAINEFGKP